MHSLGCKRANKSSQFGAGAPGLPEAGWDGRAGCSPLLAPLLTSMVLQSAAPPAACLAQNLPRFVDPHRLMWRLWRFPDGPACGADEVWGRGEASMLHRSGFGLLPKVCAEDRT